jgi:hypothetical protein
MTSELPPKETGAKEYDDGSDVMAEAQQGGSGNRLSAMWGTIACGAGYGSSFLPRMQTNMTKDFSVMAT